MLIAETPAALRQVREAMTGSIGLVPTMGALHAGHMILVERARAENDHVIATIFINPTQFAPDEDLDSYPRDLAGDLEKLDQAGVDCVFLPEIDHMYPTGYQTYVTVTRITQDLEGAHRPGHFRGVTTIVTKLFNLTQPTVAYFGQKDAQQVVVIRRMVADLNMPVRIAIQPTVREDDGLALSSRNVYLNETERRAAGVLNRALRSAAAAYREGERSIKALQGVMVSIVDGEALAEPDYVSVVLADTLHPLTRADERPLLASLAVKIGKARLIDNMLLPDTLNTRDGLESALGYIPPQEDIRPENDSESHNGHSS